MTARTELRRSTGGTGQARARALIERVLRGGDPLAPECPLVFEARFPGRLLALDGEGRPLDAEPRGGEARSACGLLARDFLVGPTRVRGGLIGSVVTDPLWRERGLATRLLAEAERRLARERCAFALLWGEDPGFYARRGWGPIGAEYDFALPFELAPCLPGTEGVRPLEPGDAAAIQRLYERHPTRVVRTPEETQALLACPGMSTLVLERRGELVAYACLGRGRDLDDTIHEWGGPSADVLAVIHAHLDAARRRGGVEHLFLMAPTSARDLYLRLENLGVPCARGMLGLGKILDRAAAARTLGELLGPRARVEVDPADAATPFVVSGPANEGRVDDEGALALLAGVGEVRPAVEDFLTRFGLEGARLPLEPFAWGLDSI